MIHSKSDVLTNNIGRNTNIWQYCVILEGAVIGEDCNINAHVLIENDVIIGNRVTVKSGVQLWDGIRLESDVFVGPNVTFTNDSRPRSKRYPDSYPVTLIRKGASIGANATLLPEITVGEFSMIGAGSVITKNVPDRALVVGVPARIVGWLNEDGTRMLTISDNTFKDCNGNQWIQKGEKLEPCEL